MPIRLTPQMKQRLTRRAHEMIERSFGYFPELQDATITVGYTRKHLGSATVIYRKGDHLPADHPAQSAQSDLSNHRPRADPFGSGLGPRRPLARSADPAKVPSGEQQCDIWTLGARSAFLRRSANLYQDAARDPRALAGLRPQVRDLCIAAIEKRHTYRPIHPLAGAGESQVGAKRRGERNLAAAAQLLLPRDRI